MLKFFKEKFKNCEEREKPEIAEKTVKENEASEGYGKYCIHSDSQTSVFEFPNRYRVCVSEYGASYARRHGIRLVQVFKPNGEEIVCDSLKAYGSELGVGTVQVEDIHYVFAEVKEFPVIM